MNNSPIVGAATLCLFLTAVPSAEIAAAAEEAAFSAAKSDSGVRIHEVQSPYQSEKTLIRVLLPDHMPAGNHLPTIYVLPVEAGVESRYGDGLKEVQSRNLHNEFTAVFVAPTFSQLPWYADHP